MNELIEKEIKTGYIVTDPDREELKARYRTLIARSKDVNVDMMLRLKALHMAYGISEAYDILFGESIKGEHQ